MIIDILKQIFVTVREYIKNRKERKKKEKEIEKEV